MGPRGEALVIDIYITSKMLLYQYMNVRDHLEAPRQSWGQEVNIRGVP